MPNPLDIGRRERDALARLARIVSRERLALERVARLRRDKRIAVLELRDFTPPVPWEAIGAILGTSPQRAHQIAGDGDQPTNGKGTQ